MTSTLVSRLNELVTEDWMGRKPPYSDLGKAAIKEIDRLTAALATAENTARINLKVAQDRGRAMAEAEARGAAAQRETTLALIDKFCRNTGSELARDAGEEIARAIREQGK